MVVVTHEWASRVMWLTAFNNMDGGHIIEENRPRCNTMKVKEDRPNNSFWILSDATYSVEYTDLTKTHLSDRGVFLESGKKFLNWLIFKKHYEII